MTDLKSLYTFRAVTANSTIPTADSYDAVNQLIRAALRGEPVATLHVEKLENGQWRRYAPADKQFAERLPKAQKKRDDAAKARAAEGKPERKGKIADTVQASLRNLAHHADVMAKLPSMTPEAWQALELAYSLVQRYNQSQSPKK